MEKTYADLKRLKEKNGEIEFEAQVPEPVLEGYIKRELAYAGRNVSAPGFRKGKVPEHILRESIDEQELLETAADESLRDAIKEIIKDERLSILGRPELTITKIAMKNPVGFKVRFALFPTVTLPDYKAIGKKISERKDTVEVTGEELQEAIDRLLQMVAPTMQMPEENSAPEGSTENDAAKEKAPTPKLELTDDLAKKFGNFKNVDEFKAMLKTQLVSEKELAQKESKREEIMKEIVDEAKVKIPELLVDQEWRAFTEERDADLARAGLSLEEYLKQTKKNEKTLEKDERALIEKQVTTSLVFREIQKQENIEASEEEIHSNMAYLKSRYPDRDNASLHQTAEAVILQEKVFDLLGAGVAAETEAEPETGSEPETDIEAEVDPD